MPTQYFNSATITSADGVTVNLTKVYEDGGQIGVYVTLSDAALTARAVADGRTAWDNSDLYALASCQPYPVA